MNHDPLPFTVPDLSAFAQSLRREMARQAPATPPPGHVQTLNLVARALGHRNVQTLQAALRLPPPSPAPAAEDRPPAMPLSANARKTLAQFDSRGRLLRWPVKFSVQRLAMWVLWTHFDSRRIYTEAEVNAVLRPLNAFGDHVTLRRELIDHRLLTRKSDCSEYRKLRARPDAEAQALLQAWRGMMRAPSPQRRVQRAAPS